MGSSHPLGPWRMPGSSLVNVRPVPSGPQHGGRAIGRVVTAAEVAALAVHLVTKVQVTGGTFDSMVVSNSSRCGPSCVADGDDSRRHRQC